jgi:tRNA-specific 2-thiouridylase
MNNKVVLGLSGGVDSAVAAVLLKQSGYKVHGLYLITCPAYEQGIDKAETLARQLAIPLTILDIQADFQQKVILPFAQSYYTCQTPSPCMECNRVIKWHYLLNQADIIGARYVATGHYARVMQNEAGLFELHKGLDPNKDQSYMLSCLSQRELIRTLLPLGTLNKHDVRTIAEKNGLNIPESEESQDLCFLQGTNYRDYLEEHFDFSESPGPIKLSDGTLLAEHDGLSAYTIGQRKGLPAFKHALFVLEKRPSDNTLVVGGLEELGQNTFSVHAINWISGQVAQNLQNIHVKIRYRSTPVPCEISLGEKNKARIHTFTPLRDITPGQFAVFYQDDRVLGSGIIS